MPDAMNYPCPYCGAVYALTPEYLAQYGGQFTTCTNCQRPFPLPAAPGAAGQAAAVSAGQPMPGQPMPSHPAAVLPYAGPAYAPGTGVWAEGDQVVAANGAILPDVCAKCGGPAEGPPRTRTFYWHHPAVYIALLSPLIYVILALVLRKSGRVTYRLCARHRARRMWATIGGWSAVLVGLSLLFIGPSVDRPELLLLGIVVILAGAIAGLLTARMLYPVKIDDRFLWLRGAGRGFLEQLPPVPAPAYPGPVYGSGYPPNYPAYQPPGPNAG